MIKVSHTFDQALALWDRPWRTEACITEETYLKLCTNQQVVNSSVNKVFEVNMYPGSKLKEVVFRTLPAVTFIIIPSEDLD